MNDAEILRLIGLVDKDTHREIYVQAAKLIAKADAYFKPVGGLIVPEFKYDLRGRTAGKAYAKRSTQTYTIQLNNEALHNPEYKEHMITDTVPHEVAHTVVQQLYPTHTAHGWKWEEVMYLFGVEPERTHNLPLKKARKTRRFIHNCLQCDVPWNMGLNAHRKLVANPNYYRCNTCKVGKFNPNGREVR